MGEDLIRYDVLAQEAFRGVVRKVLSEVAHAGLPGEHHFFIAFDTRASGVRMSSRLRERYPEEMTIVIQHQYWDLVVSDYAFEVGLSFSGVPERLLVPFSAIRGFFDPSVEFAVRFEPLDEAPAAGKAEADASAPAAPPAPAPRDAGTPPVAAPAPKKASPAAAKPAAKVPAAGGADKPVAETAKTDEEGKSASVVSLDAFRKKP